MRLFHRDRRQDYEKQTDRQADKEAGIYAQLKKEMGLANLKGHRLWESSLQAVDMGGSHGGHLLNTLSPSTFGPPRKALPLL